MSFKSLYISFYNKPLVGVIAGFSSSVSLYIQNILTNEHLLKMAAGLGVYVGLGVALISFTTGCIRLYHIIQKHFYNKRHEPKQFN